MAIPRRILITGNMDRKHIQLPGNEFEVEVVPFINIRPVTSERLLDEISRLAGKQLHVVFTSANAVRAVADVVTNAPSGWQVFSIAGPTTEAVEEHFAGTEIKATAFSAELLADEILKNEAGQELVFFCGDIRRDDLPERLCLAGREVKELVVYETVASPVALSKQYDAYAFFSPSAVKSFFSMNTLPAEAVCFAIGQTTANALNELSNNKVLIAQPPRKERVVEMMKEYFDNEPTEK